MTRQAAPPKPAAFGISSPNLRPRHRNRRRECRSPDSHKKFKEKFHLNFPLLSDPDKKMMKEYGVWKEKSMYGKKFMGIEAPRMTMKMEKL